MKKYITVLFLTTLIIPSITFASWWNPLSWSKNPKQNIDVVEPNSVQSIDESVSIPEIKPKEVIKPKVVEKIVEKPIVKTITVQDPALQAQINSLITENTSLKAEVDKLMKANNSLNNELLICEDRPVSSAQSDCEKARELSLVVQKKIEEITAICREKRKKAGAGVNFVCTEGIGATPLLDKLKITKADIKLYCD